MYLMTINACVKFPISFLNSVCMTFGYHAENFRICMHFFEFHKNHIQNRFFFQD